MKTLRGTTKKATALVMAMLLLFATNSMAVFAADVNTEDIAATASTTIPSFGNHTVGGGATHYSSGFGVRANQSVRLDVTIVQSSGNYPLAAMVYTRDGNTKVATANFYSSGSHTFYLPEGGSYFIAFNSGRNSSYTFNYTITY